VRATGGDFPVKVSGEIESIYLDPNYNANKIVIVEPKLEQITVSHTYVPGPGEGGMDIEETMYSSGNMVALPEPFRVHDYHDGAEHKAAMPPYAGAIAGDTIWFSTGLSGLLARKFYLVDAKPSCGGAAGEYAGGFPTSLGYPPSIDHLHKRDQLFIYDEHEE
jgi:hypothetical protein